MTSQNESSACGPFERTEDDHATAADHARCGEYHKARHHEMLEKCLVGILIQPLASFAVASGFSRFTG